MPRLAIYLLYAAVALRGSFQVAARRDPSLTILALVIYGVLLFSEPWLSQQMAARGKGVEKTYQVGYLLAQTALFLLMVLPGPTPDTFLVLFFPPAYEAVQFFGWKAGRWWIVAFLLPMLGYVLRHPEINNLIMALASWGGCFLLGALAGMMHRAEAARGENLRMAEELRQAQRELQKYTDQVEELAAERARTQLARELHDSVTQTVFSLNLAVEAARLMLPHGPDRTAAQLDKVQSLAHTAIGEIGKLVSQLQPAEETAQDLVSGIRQLATRYQQTGELQVEVRIDSDPRQMSVQASSKLLQILQEALANVKKHAGVQAAVVSANLAARPAWVEVQDCGRGFDLQSAMQQPGHMGLVEMSERAREIGWQLTIETDPGQGTRLRLEESRGE